MLKFNGRKKRQWEKMLDASNNDLRLGLYFDGIAKAQTALEIAANLSNVEVAVTLGELGNLCNAAGQYERAELYYKDALGVGLKDLAPGNKAAILDGLATLYLQKGELENAVVFFLRTRTILEYQCPNDQLSLSKCLSNLGSFYTKQGFYEKAKPMYQKSLEIQEKVLGEKHPDFATSLNNYANLYSHLGLYNENVLLLRRVLIIRQEIFGDEHPIIAATLHNLSTVYRCQGLYEEARCEGERAIVIYEKTLGLFHPETAIALDNLATVFHSLRLYDQALPLFLQSLEISEQLVGVNHYSHATTLNNICSVYCAQGLYKKAESNVLRAIEILEAAFGINHPNVTFCLENLAQVNYFQGKHLVALEYYKISLCRRYNFLRGRLSYISEQEHLLYLKDIVHTRKLLLSLVYKHLRSQPLAIAQAFQSIILTKALSATAIATRNALLHSDRYSHIKPLLTEINQLTALSNGLDYKDSTLAQIHSRIREIEIQIAQSAIDVMLPELQTIVPQAIALRLPLNSSLVEFIKLEIYNFDDNSWEETIYLAFITSQGQPDQVQMVDLSTATQIDALVTNCRAAILQDFDNDNKHLATIGPKVSKSISATIKLLPSKVSTNALIDFYTHLIEPLFPHLSTPQIVIAPDGDLCHLPFKLFLHNRQITYIPTGRDLVRNPSNKKASHSLIITNPDFTGAAEPVPLQIIDRNIPAFAGLSELDDFLPLQGMDVLGKLIANQTNAQYYDGITATKAAITNSASSHFLGILTHGFTLPITATESDPMARSGLAFSGANTNKANILLANEIATLDLHSNDLTLLVACQTALGDIKPGEGVYGLRRAFAIAGAKTLIATLWDIPVLASIILIEKFFQNLQTMGKGAALINAQDYLRTITIPQLQKFPSGDAALAELQKLNYILDGVECPFAHPYFWATWICQGDTGSMAFPEEVQ